MDVTSCLIDDKKRKITKANNIQLSEDATDKIIKAKKINEFENIKFEKNIEKSIESLYILKDRF